MAANDNNPSVAVVGAGAVGSYFGALLARAGVDVMLIGRPDHVNAITDGGLRIDSTTHGGSVRVRASSDVRAVAEADVIVVAVKTVDTETTAREFSRYTSPGAVAVSLQNGVENAAQIHAASGLRTVPAAVYVAVGLTAPGQLRHLGRGDLVVGTSSSIPSGATTDDVALVASLFQRAGVPCRIVPDIAPEMWTKLAMNCAYNAISALTRRSYGVIAADARGRELIASILREVVAVADASAVRLDEGELFDGAMKLAAGMRDTLSSTAHDLVRGRRTEIDSLNGFVARRGSETGVDTPVNSALLTLVRIAETATAASA
jgi:2-dehydropantoate 2-reductase